MDRELRSVVLALLTLAVAAPVWAGTAADAFRVREPCVRAVPPGMPNSAAFMTLTK